MDNNWRPFHVEELVMVACDWRSQLQADSMRGIVNKIMDTLKSHLPFFGQEGLLELKKIAVSQIIYGTFQWPVPYNLTGNSNWPPDPGSFAMQPQGPNQGQSLSMPLPSSLMSQPLDPNQPLDPSSMTQIAKMDTLKKHPPFPRREGLQELMEIAVRIEEKAYAAATSWSDYLRRLSLKMLTMVTKSQTTKAPSNLKRRRFCASHD